MCLHRKIMKSFERALPERLVIRTKPISKHKKTTKKMNNNKAGWSNYKVFCSPINNNNNCDQKKAGQVTKKKLKKIKGKARKNIYKRSSLNLLSAWLLYKQQPAMLSLPRPLTCLLSHSNGRSLCPTPIPNVFKLILFWVTAKSEKRRERERAQLHSCNRLNATALH